MMWHLRISLPWLVFAASGFVNCYVEQQVLKDVFKHTNPVGIETTSDGGSEYDATFETPEHASIGDNVKLRYNNEAIPGSKFTYPVNNLNLSFGDVLALAGDYFAKYDYTSCATSISTAWNESLESGIKVGLENAQLLQNSTDSLASCVLDHMKDMRNATLTGLKNGKDPAQIFNERADADNKYFARCSIGYAIIALCNPDHFGNDTTKAYSALHTIALQKAVEAGNQNDTIGLKDAYFYEAFGQHFLTDLFSAGHIRTPRRTLHSTRVKLLPWPDFPGDRCAQRMHDEDSANGLWVTNKLGESWASYGDKQMLHGKARKNLQVMVEACQMGVDEVWEAFRTGRKVEAEAFGALRKAPIVESAFGPGNFIPLFQQQNSSAMLFRSEVEIRETDYGRMTLEIPIVDNNQWVELDKTIQQSGTAINLYPFTKSFRSDTRIFHLRGSGKDGNTVIGNFYGDVDAGPFGTSWSMNSQLMASLPLYDGAKTWTSVEHLGDGVISLVGRLSTDNSSNEAYHVGIRVRETGKGQATLDVLWNTLCKDDNSDRQAGEVLYGRFASDTKAMVMVKLFHYSKSQPSPIEVWGVGVEKEPTKFNVDWSFPPHSTPNFLLPHKVLQTDPFSHLLGYTYHNQTTTWYFSHWTNNYSTHHLTTISEPHSFLAQTLLSDDSHLYLIYYGTPYPEVGKLRIDIQNTSYYHQTGDVRLSAPQSQIFNITWDTYLEQDYRLWFLTDVDGDGIKDLVAYVSQPDNLIIQILVFPGLETGLFGDPVVSPITLDPEIGSLLVGEFMKPVFITRADYTNEDGGWKSDKAIMSFFDNYGVLGVRVLGPLKEKGELRYELKGQIPAIAGQRVGGMHVGEGSGDKVGFVVL